jgi:hypothetical protein
MGFKEDYAKFTKPSAEREAFVLKTLLSLPRDQVVKNMRPITVKRPDGSTVTYKVMTDYITVDGMRVPMSGNTAQAVADHFGLALPTAQMAQDIYNNADVKVAAQPLSGTGTTIDGRHYSPDDVVRNQGVGYAPFAVSYNDRVNQQLADKGATPGGNQIVSGFAKDIVAPPAPGRLGLYGLYDNKGKPIQGGNGETPHDTAVHTEYGSYVRLVSPEVTITYPDGRTETKPVNQIYVAGRYTPPKGTGSGKPSVPKGPGTPNEIDQFFDQALTGIASRTAIYERIIRTAQAASLDPTKVVGPKEYGYKPGLPPPGYKALGLKGRAPKPIEDTAKEVLHMFLSSKYPIGSMIPFTIEGKNYMARAEVHSNSPYGISVYEATSASGGTPQSRMKMLQRVDQQTTPADNSFENFFSEIEKDL